MDPNANPAPTGEPAAPVTPPVAPPAAKEPPAPADEALSDDDKLLKQEDDDWDAAEKKIFPGLKKGKKKEGDKDEPADTTKETTTEETTTETTTVDPSKSGEEAPTENGTPEANAAATRAATREYQAQVEVVKSDVREKLFPEISQTLTDKNGDAITGIDDVMKYDNPRTGEPFTEEEAGMWFLSANQQLKDQLAVIDTQISQIADVHLNLKDEADAIKAEFGKYLDAHPEERDELWADFESTLVKDPESGLILRSPLSLEKFYRRNLKHANTATPQTTTAETTTASTTVTETTTVDPKIAEEDAKKKRAQKRADRSDIYSGGQKEVEDPEDAEWEAASKKVFGK